MDAPANDLELAACGVRRIGTDTDPDELVLTAEAERRLGWIADWLVQPLPVFREWGLQHYIDGGFRALFRGAAGTGKTMAVTALGRSTERPVYHVDTAAIVSEYIGQTEKNLQRIFAAASEEKAILLFDEADALLGKSPGVKDPHDRYANAGIGKLLRRVEAFEGLVIVTTNARAELEEDVVSRIDVIVDFPLPDAAARERLWRQILSAVKLPKAGDLDVARLAKAHELSGAEILRCVRVASVIAARADQPLDNEILQSAAAERVAMRSTSS